jgi:hypothetical protein
MTLLADRRDRICGAPPNLAMDQADRAYVATYLTGRNVLLMAADWTRCRELSQRIRDDLIHLGLVDVARTIRFADDAQASVGDLIICRAGAATRLRCAYPSTAPRPSHAAGSVARSRHSRRHAA